MNADDTALRLNVIGGRIARFLTREFPDREKRPVGFANRAMLALEMLADELRMIELGLRGRR